MPVHLWAMHKDIQKIRYKQNPSKYYAREIASAEEFDNNSAEAAKWYKKAGISATSEKLSIEKGKSCSISEPVFGDAEKYRNILADLHDGSMYYVTSFDEKKLNAAMEFYGKELVRNEQDILIHRDLSIFGKTAGYILTEYGIAYTKSKGLFKGWEPRVILFDKNTEMIVHDKEREGFDYWYVTLNGDGDNLLIYQSLPFTLAALGGEIQISTLQGDANLKIPAGTQPNTIFKMKNYGMPQLNPRGVSQKNGDLLVHVSIEVPKKLTKEQRMKLEAFSEALGENSDAKKNVKKNL